MCFYIMDLLQRKKNKGFKKGAAKCKKKLRNITCGVPPHLWPPLVKMQKKSTTKIKKMTTTPSFIAAAYSYTEKYKQNHPLI